MPSPVKVRLPCRAVLFDLDGTLVDSAPDLANSANALREAAGLAPLPYEALRPWVGTGARGMIGRALGVQPGDVSFEARKDAFLAHYEAHLLDRTRPFPGVEALLAALAAQGRPWGIVTNKHTRYARPICEGTPLLQGAGTWVAGDTTPYAKPHPAPLLEAAQRLGMRAEDCIYVGDDERDIDAARAAGMAGVVACWGYLGEGRWQDWGAAAGIEAPTDLLDLLAPLT